MKGVLSMSPSRYNAGKLNKATCELCGEAPAREMHHLAHQVNAREDNHYIDSFHKNHPANLIHICEACHTKFHEHGDQHRRMKTSDGYVTTPYNY